MIRKTIGLGFLYDNATNSGIVNYLFSLVKALNTLPNSKKPHLVIFYSGNAPIEMIKAENYPFIKFVENTDYIKIPIDFFSKIINKISRFLSGKNVIFSRKPNVDFLFPFLINGIKDNEKKIVHWLVDFNPYYFKDHLSPLQRKQYFDYIKNIVYCTNKVVLSSYNILNDLKKFHPDYTCKIEILRFAALLPPFKHVEVGKIITKFNISAPYIMTPNQFWVHKNHLLMLKAAIILKSRGVRFQMIFTGSTNVEESSDYYLSLLRFIEINKIENETLILGIIDRAEQLALMNNAEALVQPSLFEGWSTLVEESKALNKHIVVSDLTIHREQINFNCTFFDPKNEIELADILEEIFKNGAEVKPYDYNKNIQQYAEKILEIFS